MTELLKPSQQNFIELALEYDVLRFGEFALKSGRISPYFFNAGNFDSGKAMAVLGECYADAIADSNVLVDVLFGPAYKGIPLVAATAAALHTKYGRDVPFAFNRKEAKDHGEGGLIVGAELASKKVLVLDDVITAGTAVGEVVSLLDQAKATLSGVLVGLDRQEKGVDSDQSAVQQLAANYGIPVWSIVTLNGIREYLSTKFLDKALLTKVDAYREQYGV